MSGAAGHGGHRWAPPADVRAIGERARVRFMRSPEVGDGEQREPAVALVALRGVVVPHVRGVVSGGMVRGAERRAGVSRDPHRGGIACDFMLRADDTREAVGDALANWLVEHSAELGVQYVLFAGYEWSASSAGTRWEVYTGADPHHDHVHMELGPDGLALSRVEMQSRATRLLVGGSRGASAVGLGVWLMALGLVGLGGAL